LNSVEHSIERWISILYRYGQSYVSKKLRPHNIRSGQFVILLALFRNSGISQEELSGYLKLDKGSIARSIKKLEDEAYIERRVDLDDKRAHKVFLTQKALDIIPIVRESIQSWEDLILSDLSDSERQLVEQLLYNMARKAYGIKERAEIGGN
jgi:DNA-binding MarR family transcriptional regulator